MSLPLSNKGTLLSFSKEGDAIIYPYNEEGAHRGGAFWCLPNFDEAVPPFTLRHGEYRITRGETNEDIHVKSIHGPWGSLATSCTWSEDETGLSSTLCIKALSHETLVRPGFHPYFVIKEDLLILIEGVTFQKNSIPLLEKLVIPCNENSAFALAEMQTKSGKYSVRCEAISSTTSRFFSYGFCLWTDNLEKYICIEPVVGVTLGEDNLPLVFSLLENETIKIFVQITKQK